MNLEESDRFDLQRFNEIALPHRYAEQKAAAAERALRRKLISEAARYGEEWNLAGGE